jgi:hypothetical protein
VAGPNPLLSLSPLVGKAFAYDLYFTQKGLWPRPNPLLYFLLVNGGVGCVQQNNKTAVAVGKWFIFADVFWGL